MFFHYIVYIGAFILCIQALPVEENSKKDFKGFKHLGSLKRNGPDGTIMESEYFLSETAEVWVYALLTCYAGMDMNLLIIEDEAEDNFTRDLLFAEGLTGGVWSSGYYREEGNGWVWAKDENIIPITYFNFKASPTNSSDYNILPNGTPGNYGWSTALGDLSFKYICERNIVTKEK